jgi:hypothetical protein
MRDKETMRGSRHMNTTTILEEIKILRNELFDKEQKLGELTKEVSATKEQLNVKRRMVCEYIGVQL